MRTKYGFSLSEYEEMLIKQEHKCAICKTSDPVGRNGKFHVDHDHKTGKVRGLLCHHCNVALGSMNDSIEILKNAIKYLKLNQMNEETKEVETTRHFPEEKLSKIREEASLAYNEERLNPYWFSLIINMCDQIDAVQQDFIDMVYNYKSYNNVG